MSQPPPPPPFPHAQPQQPGNGLAVAALVLGIVSLVLAAIPIVNLLGAVAALVGVGLGIAGIRRGRTVGRGTAMAGWGTGLSAVAVVVSVTITFIAIRYLGDLLDFVEPPDPSVAIGEEFHTDDGDLVVRVTSASCADTDELAATTCTFTFDARNASDRYIFLDGVRVKGVVSGHWQDAYLEGNTALDPGDTSTITGSLDIYDGKLEGLAFDADDASSHSAVVVDASAAWAQSEGK
ncbi:DUF4190 domain-containing protein [Nocardioides panacisoli]|uniref:DUF4190 domain-containing protein n=1 Tax=Nocardioides panacisoli TaxID=627624 RepID=A0ABP7J231_9ACTN